MEFLLVFDNEKIHIYNVENNYARYYFSGNDFVFYDKNNIELALNSLSNELSKAFSISVPDIKYSILGVATEAINNKFIEKAGTKVKKIYYVDDIIGTIMEKLIGKDNLMIDEYGINYNGRSYRVVDGDIIQYNFSLLGYTISDDEFISEIKNN